MKLSTIAIFFVFIVSLSPVLAATYIIEHDDEIDDVQEMRTRSSGRESNSAEIAQLKQEIEQLRTEYAKQDSDRIKQDYYSRLRSRCSGDDMDELDDLLDQENLTADERHDLRLLLDRCNLYGDDPYYDGYYDDTYCTMTAYDYSDNFNYYDYLADARRVGRCDWRRHLRQDVFDDYYDDFAYRYETHNTSYDPATDVLHELSDEDFYKFGPGAYERWGDWCRSNRYDDGTYPGWCYERKRFMTDIEWN